MNDPHRPSMDVLRLVRWVVLPPLLAAVVLLGGLPVPLGQLLFVTVNGTAVAVSPGTAVGYLAEAPGLSDRSGALVDIAGDTIRPRGGVPGVVQLNGTAAVQDQRLADGDALAVHRGKAASEPLERLEKSIAYELRSEGSGPVLALVEPGKPGSMAVYAGRSSDRVVLEYVAKAPVDAVLRRSGGLSPGQKAVALTFDDGPSEFTRDILDVLSSKGASATFFWIGRVASGSQSMVRAARGAGHEVENHSWSHADLKTLTPEEVASEITRTDAALGGSRFLRPPYGSYDAAVAEQAGLLGHRLVLWDVDTLDWKTRDAAAILAKVKAQARAGAIILMHDGGGDRSQTAAALPAVIDWLLSQGYALTTVGHLVG